MNRLVYILLFFLILTNGAKAQDAEFLLPGKIAIAEANNFLKKAKLIESENFALYDFFTVYYHGEPGNTGFGSFSQAKHGDVPIIWLLLRLPIILIIPTFWNWAMGGKLKY